MRLGTGLAGLTLAGVVALGSASAADLYGSKVAGGLKDGPYVPVSSWTGFYAGVNGGYGWSADDSKLSLNGNNYRDVVTDAVVLDAPNSLSRKFDSEGGFGGGQIGYNLQRGVYVVGIEADIQGSDISGSASVSDGDVSARAKSELNWFGTVRGRIGYAMDNTLFYATGGLAYGEVKDTLTLSSYREGAKASKSDTLTGYVVGGGIEHKFTPNWSLKAEYQYLDLGSNSLGAEICEYGTYAKFDHTYHTVRVGLNYHVGSTYEPLK